LRSRGPWQSISTGKKKIPFPPRDLVSEDFFRDDLDKTQGYEKRAQLSHPSEEDRQDKGTNQDVGK
jgi:hypothetical protein